jgi:hypothetical protein
MDATRQREIDYHMMEMDGTPNKARLGGTASAPSRQRCSRRPRPACVFHSTSTSADRMRV